VAAAHGLPDLNNETRLDLAPFRVRQAQIGMPANLATHDSPPGSMAAPAVRRRWPYLRTSVEVFQFELQN